MSLLPVSRLINVSVTLSPLAAQGANLNALLILGNSDVIDTTERMRAYATIGDVANDFGSTSPEYLAAVLYFEQAPQPQTLYIGRWARTATHGLIKGGLLSPSDVLYDFSVINSGSMDITVDGVVHHLSGLNFTSATNLNAVAGVLNTALAGVATVVWNGEQFVVESDTTGSSSTVTYATNVGVDHLADLTRLANHEYSRIVNGISAETPVACLTVFIDRFSNQFFGVMFADTTLVNVDHENIAAFIEADKNHMYGATTQETAALDSSSTTDLAYLLHAAGYNYSFVQYSSQTPYAVASMFGRAFSVNFNGNNTTITLMYKQEPGIVAETLSTSQANALQNKRANVFVGYNNSTAILQYGTMAGSAYFDDIHGLAWLKNRIQTDVYNLLYLSPTKIPQTDAGNHLIETTIESGCAQAVNNGLVAPGQWNSGGFGTLNTGDFMPKGYFIYAPPISSQAQSDRDARKSVPFQVAVKLAGAVHTVDVSILVNR